jgi:hypothetical protein
MRSSRLTTKQKTKRVSRQGTRRGTRQGIRRGTKRVYRQGIRQGIRRGTRRVSRRRTKRVSKRRTRKGSRKTKQKGGVGKEDVEALPYFYNITSEEAKMKINQGNQYLIIPTIRQNVISDFTLCYTTSRNADHNYIYKSYIIKKPYDDDDILIDIQNFIKEFTFDITPLYDWDRLETGKDSVEKEPYFFNNIHNKKDSNSKLNTKEIGTYFVSRHILKNGKKFLVLSYVIKLNEVKHLIYDTGQESTSLHLYIKKPGNKYLTALKEENMTDLQKLWSIETEKNKRMIRRKDNFKINNDRRENIRSMLFEKQEERIKEKVEEKVEGYE